MNKLKAGMKNPGFFYIFGGLGFSVCAICVIII